MNLVVLHQSGVVFPILQVLYIYSTVSQAAPPCLSHAASGFSCVPATQCDGAGLVRTNHLEGTFDSLGAALLDLWKRDVSGLPERR